MYKLVVGMTALFELLAAAMAFSSIASRQWGMMGKSFLAMISLLLPLIISRGAMSRGLCLPTTFEVVAVLFIFCAQYLGELKNFYHLFWWWDILLHGAFGGYAVIVAKHLVQGIIVKEQAVSEQRFKLFIGIFAFCFAVALGAIWEVFEFLGDYLTGFNMVKGGLADTAGDLLVKILVALAATILCCRSTNRQK